MAEEVLARLAVAVSSPQQYLNISGMRLTELPESDLWANIKILNCSNNLLSTLPQNLNSLSVLHCADNVLVSLPASLTALTNLICTNNLLESIPTMPKLQRFYCGSNRLTSLPEIPSVTTLACYSNQLTMLPYLPKLEKISYSVNRFHIRPKYSRWCWEIYKFTEATILIRRWRRNAMINARERKRDLHNELLYSPELPFVYHTPEARRWLEMIILRGYQARTGKK